ncbi:MAG: DUF3455 domain-containing protein [Rhodospirillales bacterium]|nr:DUF3455 domain-containing protein [Rhodospirillales bacterium]MDE2318087.1 DUF3455 domain-containing protein [Rhodospirillales bacterium]
MLRNLPCLAFAAALAGGAAAAAPPSAQEYTGRGTQVYSCALNGGAPAWKLLGPDAHMYSKAGTAIARHYFGPRWQAEDGSEIKGTVITANTSPAGPRNAPWLVLHTISEGKSGIFAEVTTVTRTDTHGGGVPGQACTQSNQGMIVKVPYSARYTFFSEIKPAPAGG